MDRTSRKSTGSSFWLALLVVACVQSVIGLSIWSDGGMAYAQDDDGGDDGGDDDDGREASGVDNRVGAASRRSGNEGTRSPSRNLQTNGLRRTRVVQAAPPPEFAAGEIVVTNLSEVDLAALLVEGFIVIERIELFDVAVVMHRLRVPDGLTLEQARDRVRAQPTGATGDFNHYYRTGEDALSPASGVFSAPVAMAPVANCAHMNCSALKLIGWPAERDLSPVCRVTVPVGVIDTGVNAAHENLVGARIEVLRLLAEDVDPSKAVHGTAIAGLLVGQVPDRTPGLIPEANLVVVDIFGRKGDDERASVASLIKALDLLAQRKVKVINLSLAGPANAALEAALLRLTSPGGAIVLAAVGNGGPAAQVAYPAGYLNVVAVTAVDQRGQVYRRAQRGMHIDLAAPGVEVWSATSVSGVKPKTGTSFAVPFASAAAAVLASRNPEATPHALAAQLRGLVRDMGAQGADEVFGAGLLALDTLCGPKIPAVPVE